MTARPDGLTCDGFLGGRLQIWQPALGYRAAIDPVLLAAFVPARAGELVLDLGCGVGTAGLCLSARVPGIALHGLELQEPYAELARRNAATNGLAFEVHCGDLRCPPAALRSLAFDHVLINPPYHPAGAVMASRDPGRDRAMREGAADLSDWIAAGLRRLRPGGRLALVHRAERLGAILAGIGIGAGGIEILPLAPRAGRAATRVLVAARKDSKAPLMLRPPLTLHDNAISGIGNSYTEAIRNVLRGASSLDLDASER